MVAGICTNSWSYKTIGGRSGLWRVCDIGGNCTDISSQHTDRKFPLLNVTWDRSVHFCGLSIQSFLISVALRLLCLKNEVFLIFVRIFMSILNENIIFCSKGLISNFDIDQFNQKRNY